VPQDLVYDGANIRVAKHKHHTVTKLGASSGAVLGTFATGPSPDGVLFDGVNIWAANSGSNTISKF